MADNVTAPVGDGIILATDEVSSAHYQRIKVAWGVDGSAVDASATNPFPVTVSNASLAVTGTFWQATQPVSLATAPLPTGAATDSTISTMSGKLPASLGAQNAASSLSVVPATGATFPVSGTFWQATQPVSGTVGVSGSVAVTGTFWQATQPVSLATAPALVASEAFIGQVGSPVDLIDVTATLDTSAYADGDVLMDTATITNATRVNAGCAMLQSLLLLDESDQGQPLDLYFFTTNVSLGTKNSAPNISDTDARNILGKVAVSADDYFDLGGARVASLKSIGLLLKATTGSRAVYVSAISRGTGTYAAAGIRLRLGILQA